MAEITRRRTGELFRLLFDILMEEPEGLQARYRKYAPQVAELETLDIR